MIIRILSTAVFLLLSLQAAAFDRSSYDIRFDRLDAEDGLSQNTVFCILQDRRDFMWFGTQDGLNRYDGYEFTPYKKRQWVKSVDDGLPSLEGEGDFKGFEPLPKKHPENTNSLSGNFISDMYEDVSGFLWISTRNDGLNRYDLQTDSYTG